MPSMFSTPGRLTASILVTLAILMTAPQPRAAGEDVLSFKATEGTLANGLKVIVVPTGFPNLVSVQIPVQTGSRNEVEPGKSGFAHFFEHLMFRGTPGNPPKKFREIMGKAGARDNASTGCRPTSSAARRTDTSRSALSPA
jgi:zinc protease